MRTFQLPAGVKPQFSGHETFPLRLGWLKKVFDGIRVRERAGRETATIFSADDAIARFGVGKNMVNAMRHWSEACGVIRRRQGRAGSWHTTRLGQLVFEEEGWDPWEEDPDTLWLWHWHLASTPEKTLTWYWMFNYYPQPSFDRERVVSHLAQWCKDPPLKRVALSTLKRDVECFIQTYTEKEGRGAKGDALTCPLIELMLLSRSGARGTLQMIRGPKPTLSVRIFALAVIQYWQRRYGGARTMSFESMMHEPGSPGRVFMLDENSLMDLVQDLEVATGGHLVWSETAGMRQLLCTEHPDRLEPFSTLERGHRAYAV